MEAFIEYAGREQGEPDEWTVFWDLVTPDSPRKRYWLRFRVYEGDPDVGQPNFWGYVAYLGAKFIENRQIFDNNTGELYSPIEEAVDRSRGSLTHFYEPRVGQVCWRFGSPPYDADTSGDMRWSEPPA